MSLREASAVFVIVATSACAASRTTPSVSPAPEDARNASAASSARNAASGPNATKDTTLTSVTVITPTRTRSADGTSNPIAVNPSALSREGELPFTHDTKVRWSDGQIVAATAAAAAAQETDAKLAREHSKSARVERFAQQLILDQRELDAQQARMARVIPASPSDISARVEAARRPLSQTTHESSAKFDRDFLMAEIEYSKKLVRLLDDEMIPSATSPEVKSYLEALRTKTDSHLLQAQEILDQLP